MVTEIAHAGAAGPGEARKRRRRRHCGRVSLPAPHIADRGIRDLTAFCAGAPAPPPAEPLHPRTYSGQVEFRTHFGDVTGVVRAGEPTRETSARALRAVRGTIRSRFGLATIRYARTLVLGTIKIVGPLRGTILIGTTSRGPAPAGAAMVGRTHHRTDAALLDPRETGRIHEHRAGLMPNDRVRGLLCPGAQTGRGGRTL